ncbi:MAG: ATP-dependent protease ATPase subunit HslU [Armatimonadetes bacterium]|nr:ATP-dependent protease ATPase subunit HslU [Armatimonadota bacterium]
MDDLTPRQIVEELDKYIIGQQNAKRAVAIALRNRTRRKMLVSDLKEEVIPKNILMIGPTGVGKTEIARRLAALADAPFIKIEATKFTEVGYVGRDVDSIIRDLLQVAVRMAENERMASVQERAQELAVERILDILEPLPESRRPSESSMKDTMENVVQQIFGGANRRPPAPPEDSEVTQLKTEQKERIRARLRDQVRSGSMDDRSITVEVEDSGTPVMQVFGPQGMEEMGLDIRDMLGNMMQRRTRSKRTTIGEARRLLAMEEARKLIDFDEVKQEAIERVEESGIIFLDELDKIAGREKGTGPDVSREGVQRDLLPIIEGSTVVTRYGPVQTNHILFIAAGAFHVSKPSDLIPELQGRLPIRVELENLDEGDFKRILTEPRNALIKQYKALLATEDVAMEFTEDGIAEIAHLAAQVNSQAENIGARRLHTIMERVMDEISFSAPDRAGEIFTIDAAYVRQALGDIVQNEDLSRYIL